MTIALLTSIDECRLDLDQVTHTQRIATKTIAARLCKFSLTLAVAPRLTRLSPFATMSQLKTQAICQGFVATLRAIDGPASPSRPPRRILRRLSPNMGALADINNILWCPAAFFPAYMHPLENPT